MLASFSTPTWYQQLAKPPTVPPDWVFFPVWTVLYILLAAGIWLFVRTSPKRLPSLTYATIVVHLFFNFIWSYLFFTRHLILTALIDCLLILCSLVVLMALFFLNNRWACFLQIPYLVWASFASYLNLHIYLLNR